MTEQQARELDAAAFVAMLEDDNHIEALLSALEKRHAMDMGGPVMLAVTRAHGLIEMLAIELRLIRNYTLGGA